MSYKERKGQQLLLLVKSILLYARKKHNLVKQLCFLAANALLFIARYLVDKDSDCGVVVGLAVTRNNFFKLPLMIENCFVKNIIRRKFNEALNFFKQLSFFILNNNEKTIDYLQGFFAKIMSIAYYKISNNKGTTKQLIIEGHTDKMCFNDPIWLGVTTTMAAIKGLLTENYSGEEEFEKDLDINKFFIYFNKSFKDLVVFETNNGFLCIFNLVYKDTMYPSLRRKIYEQDFQKALAFVNYNGEIKLFLFSEEASKILDNALSIIELSLGKCSDAFYVLEPS
jgi:hypothetical protein